MDKRYYILGGALILLIIFGTILFVSSRKPKTTELNWITYGEDEKNFQEIIPAFEAANNVKINFQKKDLKNYEVESLNILSTGRIDIWGIPLSWLPKQHDKLTSPPLTLANIYGQLYPASIVKDNTIKNKIYGFPLSLDGLVLFSNSSAKSAAMAGREFTKEQEDLLSKKPDNWQDLAGQAKLLTTKAGSQITRSGLALGTANLDVASDILTALMLQYGTKMTNDDNTQATFHTAVNLFGGDEFPGAAALDFYASFAEKDNANYSFSTTLGDARRAFAEGKVAYLIDYSSIKDDLQRINPDLDFQINPLPQVRETKNPVNFLSYETFTVPKTSPNQTLAWKFIEFLVNNQNSNKYYTASQKYPALAARISDDGGLVAKLVESAASWYNPDPTQTDEIFRSAITQVLAGKSSQTALESAALQVTDLLGKIKE